MKKGAVLIAALLVLLWTGWTGLTFAKGVLPGDAKLVEELRGNNPEAALAFDQGIAAVVAGDAKAAEEAFARVLERAPTFTPALRERGYVLVHLERPVEAVRLGRKAVALDPSNENESALAFFLARDDQGNHGREALALATKISARAPDDGRGLMLVCEAANAAHSVPDLKRCSEGLLRVAPDETNSQLFAIIAAIHSADPASARKHFERVRELGISPALDAKLTKAVEDCEANEGVLSKWGPLALKVLGGWLAGFALLLGFSWILSRATLRLARRLSPEDRGQSQGALLRKVYGAVLHLSCFYYYLSLPLVLLIVVGSGGGIIASFFMIGRIPIQLVVIIGTAVLFTVWSVLKSLLVRTKDVDPGLRIELRKHPKLAKVLEEVAARVGTRPVDCVYMTPQAEMAVTERGGLSRQLRGGNERCLVIGAALLDGMKLGPFRAILAHEYGHFTNQDTAGGGFALGVRRSLMITAMNLIQNGAAAWYNPAWWFVMGFQRVFLRVSQGASRLQEVMADRWAAFSYGPEAFARGLTHVVTRSISFEAHVQATLHDVITKERPLANLYSYEPPTKIETADIEKAVEEAMNQEPSPYDSHPKPVDRIAWVRELATSQAPKADAESDVWDLFEDREGLQRSMTDEVCLSVVEQLGVVIQRKAPVVEAAVEGAG